MKNITATNICNEDSLLWDRFLSGDNQAYVLIYRKHVQSLFSYARQFCPNRELIKDCIQNMFEKLHRDRSKLKQTDNIRLYLFVILKNSIINALKHEQVRSRYVERELENTSIEEDTIENMLEAQEEEAIIQQKVNQIFNLFTPRQKEIMYFRYVEEMDIKDIAQLMEMNYQSVQNLIQRSIKRARDYFNT